MRANTRSLKRPDVPKVTYSSGHWALRRKRKRARYRQGLPPNGRFDLDGQGAIDLDGHMNLTHAIISFHNKIVVVAILS